LQQVYYIKTKLLDIKVIMKTEMLCTIGPASMSGEVITRLEELGASLLRINLSHTSVEDMAPVIKAIREHSSVPICLDSEGAQIRTGSFIDNTLALRENSIIRAFKKPVPGDSTSINFYPLDIISEFIVGDIISIDFNSVLVQVIKSGDEGVTMRVLTGGQIGQNKAVTVEREINMPPLTKKDTVALKVGRDLGVNHFALSFANHAEDVEEIRKIIGPDAFLISKIECSNGLKNLEAIAAGCDALLIDRGDLSRQVPIELIPEVQKDLIKRCRKINKKVYVATNLLESMVSEPAPTRAEVNDIFNTLNDGADGLVLAAETAVGKYPVRCASMIVKMIQQFENGGDVAGVYHFDPSSLLVEPHGGILVHREASADDLNGIEALAHLTVSHTTLMDCEQFALGTYSPLTGFMDQETLESVLNENQLPNGLVWTMPLLLQTDAESVKDIASGDRIVLQNSNGFVHSLMDVGAIFSLDKEDLAGKWFGSTSDQHPGVARFLGGGEVLVAGNITLIEHLPSQHRHYELSPAQSRYIFTHKGWGKVVGFHGRNPAHRVHEFIQTQALKRTGADGLYISPVIGPKKPNDFLPGPILNSYRLLLEFGLYPKGKVVLGSFSTYSRYCGPREAVFTALCRKNMGCSHFIIGRDHTGVGDFYKPNANAALFDAIGDIGITPVFFGSTGYNPASGNYEEEQGSAKIESISGTMIRQTLLAGNRLPDWCIADIVQDMLLEEITAGRQVFCN